MKFVLFINLLPWIINFLVIKSSIQQEKQQENRKKPMF